MYKSISHQLVAPNLDSYFVSRRWKVQADYKSEYEVSFLKGIFDLDNATLASSYQSCGRALIFVDSKIYDAYHEKIRDYFVYHKINSFIINIHSAEEKNTFQTYQYIIDNIVSFKPNDSCGPIVAIGGSVITDTIVFACSTYRYGVPCIRIPTTLMGMINSSMGVKCAINYNSIHIGSSHHPCSKNYIDTTFLKTLPEKHIECALAEIIKMCLISSEDLFLQCELYLDRFFQHDDMSKAEPILAEVIYLMLKELPVKCHHKQDKSKMDFGNTWSTGIKLSDASILHGHATSIDMAYTLCISEICGLLDQKESDRIFELMSRAHLPIFHPLMTDFQFVKNAIESSKKHRGGQLNLPVPFSIGEYIFLDDLEDSLLREAQELYLVRINQEYPISKNLSA